MYSSQNKDLLTAIYNDKRTIFNLTDVAVLLGETDFVSLNQKLNYAVRTSKLLNPRKGIYAKSNFSMEELVCKLYTPSYISLYYVLQQAGVVFQYSTAITSVSYLNRSIEIEGQAVSYRKIKNEILVDSSGIESKNNINIATPERAFLDVLYLDKQAYFDNLAPLNQKTVHNLLPIFASKIMNQRVEKIFRQNGQ